MAEYMKGFWKDRKGINHKISDMPKPYILNCLKILRKNMKELADALGEDAMECAEFLDMAKKATELDQELLNRYAKKTNDEFWKIIKGGGLIK